MKRFVFLLATLSLIFSACDDSQFKEVFRVDLQDASGVENVAIPSMPSGWLVFSKRKVDGYWYLRLEIPNIDMIALGPEHEYYQDGARYLFRDGNKSVELGCGEAPYIWATLSSDSKLEYSPDRKTAQNIKKVLDKAIFFPPYAFPTDEVAVPEEAVEPEQSYEDVAVPEEAVEEDTSFADSSYGKLLIDGNFTETGNYHRGIGMFGASFSAPAYTYHISMYEKVLIRTFSDGSYGQYDFDEEGSKTGYRKYRNSSGSKSWICYNPQENSFYVEMESDGYTWNCDIVPAGSYNNTAPAQQYNNAPQNIVPDNSGREMMYRNQYEVWERTVQRHWQTLTTMREGGARVSVRMNFVNAQSQMRQIRQNAQMEGIHIPTSPWERASVPYSLYDD